MILKSNIDIAQNPEKLTCAIAYMRLLSEEYKWKNITYFLKVFNMRLLCFSRKQSIG